MSQIIDITIPSKQLIENTQEVFHVCYDPLFSQETKELQYILQDINVQRDLKNITIHTLVNFYSFATISIVTPEIYIFVESHPSTLNEKNSFIKNGKELRAHRVYYKFNIGNTKNLKGLTLDLSNYRYLFDSLNHKHLFQTLNPYDELAKPSEIQKVIEKGYGLVKGLFDAKRKRKLDEKENKQGKENETLLSSENESDKFIVDVVNEEKREEEDESEGLIEEQEKKKKRFRKVKEKEQAQRHHKTTNNYQKEKENTQDIGNENNQIIKKKVRNQQGFDFSLLESKIPQNKSLEKSKKKKKRRKNGRKKRRKESPSKI
ncbi:major sperm protein [Anaeramoeba flamelloides]|uniref:Major sperm protein n=1 Tax=Anaeramoeba flamelloides TaxID=1746091 RepID=A0ABQ8ZDE8_9EUKA|nr:major sperm protein [Anaeramoeba flamelloides]